MESILLTSTISCFTPSVCIRMTSSCVCPFLEMPASNLPTAAATISTSANLVCAYNHVFGKVCARGHRRWSCNTRWPQISTGRIFGDTTFTFRFQFIQDPGIPEGVSSHLSSLLLKCFSDSVVDGTTFVDHMASSGRLAQICIQ